VKVVGSRDEIQKNAAQGILDDLRANLVSRGLIRRAKSTPAPFSTPTTRETMLVAPLYKKRTMERGVIRVFVSVPRIDDEVDPGAEVRVDWSLNLGGVWYTVTATVRNALDVSMRDYASVLPAFIAVEHTVNGVVPLRSINRAYKKIKKNKSRDKAVLLGLR